MRLKTQEQREKILDAASRLFGVQRFHQVRMDDIADAAEVGKGTLYRYFQDKEELYLAVLMRSSDLLMRRMRGAIAEVEGLRAQLEAVAATLVAHFDDEPYLLDLIQRAEVESVTGKKFPWQETRNELLRLVTDLFGQAREQGENRVRSPELAVLILFGGLRAVIRFGVKPRPRDLARRFIDVFLLGADEMSHGARARTPRAQALLR